MREFGGTSDDLQREPHHRWAHPDGLRCAHPQHKVGLAGTDCPEQKQPRSTKGTADPSNCVFDQQVAVDWEKRHRYQRIVGKVLSGQRNVNLAALREGLGWWYGRYTGKQAREERGLHAETEKNARTGLGAFGIKPEASASVGVPVPKIHPADLTKRGHGDHPPVSCSTNEQARLNTLVSFQPASILGPLVGAFRPFGRRLRMLAR